MTPTTEVRYGEPVDVLRDWVRRGDDDSAEEGHGWTFFDLGIDTTRITVAQLLRLRDAIDAALLRVRYAFEKCPEGCVLGELLYEDTCLPCPICSDSDRWGIPAGTVRVRCGMCEGHSAVDVHAPDDGPVEICNRIEAGRCYEGYAVTQENQP